MQQKIAREARWKCFSFLNSFGLIVLRKHRSNIKCLSTIVFYYILLVIFFGPDRKGGKITKKLPPSAEQYFLPVRRPGL